MAGLLAAPVNPPSSSGTLTWIGAHRWALLAALLLVGGIVALGVATYRPDWLTGGRAAADRIVGNVGQKAGEAATTVAGLFDLRSPGERASGALASLKQKRQPLLHERALPKVRGPVAPLAAIVAAPPPPIETVPPFTAIAGPKPASPEVALAQTGSPGGVPGIFPGLTILPGGGGGVIIPPPATIVPPPGTPGVPVTPPDTPGSPGTPSGVPEPASWAMMILGFALVGGALRRKALAAMSSA